MLNIVKRMLREEEAIATMCCCGSGCFAWLCSGLCTCGCTLGCVPSCCMSVIPTAIGFGTEEVAGLLDDLLGMTDLMFRLMMK